MKKMNAVEVRQAKGPLQLVEREVPKPGTGQVLIKVQACGVCHSDVFTKEGQWPGLEYPRIPGHEIAGIIEEMGSGVDGWKQGQRVGVGWHGGHCGRCEPCRRGDFVLCQRGLIPGISYDGGYAEYMVAPVEALEAAPLLCAGITTFNALRNSGARPGEVVAILGIGGLGHLGVQFASKMGFETVAIARGKDKEALAKKLGARHYIDSMAQNVAEALTGLGGAKIILATVTSGKAMSATVGGLAIDGKLIMIGASEEPMEVPIVQFILGRQSVQGWPCGTSSDSQDTLGFSVMTGIRPMIEEYPLERAVEAYERMMSGEARFRVVLKVS
ncbi:MAG: alcohol dehydrogenase catalytic domain-containing protein [Nitrospirales bacterium]|nr:alcohol dehydrogenase catalytic domain-containing protein [Nitrospirales bacterium]